MTLRLLLAILSAMAVEAQVPEQGQKAKTSVEGRVINSLTGEAVRKATIRLRMFEPIGPRPMLPNSNYVATSDAQGKFVFEDLDPGRYALWADHAGFVAQPYRGSSGHGSNALAADSSRPVKGIVVELIPQATISGKVVDEDGDPLPSFHVQVFRYAYNRNGREFLPVASGTSGPDGAFTAGNLPPGRYYVAAMNSRNMLVAAQPERLATKGPAENYVMAYFPNATDFRSASAVYVAAGQELHGIEIRLQKQPVFTIRGKVAASIPTEGVEVTLKTQGPEMIIRPRQTAIIRDKDGRFEFDNIAPGNYVIESNPNASFIQRNRPDVAAYYEITVSDHDLEDVVVSLAPLAEISGTVKFEIGR